MGISRQRRGIVVLVNPVGAVKERLRGTERRHHVGRDIAGSFHIEQTHVDARGTRGCVAHAQSQPHRIKGNVFYQGDELCAARGCLVRHFGDGHIRGLPQGLQQVLRLEEKTVGQQHVSVGDIAHLAQARLKGMRIPSRGNQHGHCGILTGYVLGDVPQDRRRRHHLHLPIVSARGARAATHHGRAEKDSGKKRGVLRSGTNLPWH